MAAKKPNCTRGPIVDFTTHYLDRLFLDLTFKFIFLGYFLNQILARKSPDRIRFERRWRSRNGSGNCAGRTPMPIVFKNVQIFEILQIFIGDRRRKEFDFLFNFYIYYE